ncbi:PGF-CTERM sorting domain-containing protein [Halogeometricum limi]|uniref:PGF-CTERM protein n=1 Tax=Halogeometricum limi TaxID=555875 RepID=A0A1I6G0Z8_9EURY|nr:PGF-CTERM sorting domain-containing protein [Halogeometricum limi]SFR35865.1 PGF-CTERM protein [Halogeometricum limi]
MERTAAVFAAILVTLAAVPASGAAAAATAQSSAYAGTHVTFDAETNAVTNYTVGGATVFDSLRVESAGSAQSEASAGADADLDADASAVTDVAGSAVSVSATAETRATVTTESGAEMRVHDTPNGNLVLASDDGAQALRANVSDGASVSEDGEARVVVENGDTTSVFVAVGNASVARNDDGDVSAHVGDDGRLVLRTYGESDERTESDEQAEQLIADGTATAELYVMGGANATTEIVQYGGNTTVEVAERTNETVTVTVERSVSEGAVVLTSVSDEAVAAGDSLAVSVDGEAAAHVESASELRTAANGGEQSAYMVTESSAEADAATDVYVALNHFSERTVTMTSESDGSAETTGTTETADGDDSAETAESATDEETDTETDASSETSGTQTSTSAPGFGVTAALAALAGAALVAVRRR